MSLLNGGYSIQQVADITQLSKQLIRKWEERYGIVQPKRLDNGYRIYSERDISSLLEVKALTEKGYTVKQSVEMVMENTHNTAFEKQHFIPSFEEKQWNDFVIELIHHGTYCSEEGIQRTLQTAYYQLGLETFIQTVIIPFLIEVGNRWEKKKWTEFQESFSSLIVRDFLVPLRRNFQTKEDAPLVIGACLPHERHEVPVHLLLLQLMLKGYKTLMIGASPARGTIEALVTQFEPSIILLSATTTIPFIQEPEMLETLDRFAATQKKTQFFLGGPGAMEYAGATNLQSIRVTNSIEELIQ